MSEPLHSLPPATAPPAPPGDGVAAALGVRAPGLALVWVGGLGVVVQLGWTLLNLPAATAWFMPRPWLSDAPQRVTDLVGVTGIMAMMFFMTANAFVVWAGLQMRHLRSWGASVAAGVLVMLPGACIVAGLPIGIWSLYVLTKPGVRSAFTA
jgi:hypothetical protein